MGQQLLGDPNENLNFVHPSWQFMIILVLFNTIVLNHINVTLAIELFELGSRNNELEQVKPSNPFELFEIQIIMF